jgi:iron complex outermembrane recepter protein
MRHALRLAVLVATASLLAGVAQGQEPARPDSTEKPVQLQEITVTGSRAPKALSDLSTSISQVEREDLQEQLRLTTNILQTIEAVVPGLAAPSDLRNTTFTTIRGRTAQLLINGIPTNDNLRSSNTRGLASINPHAVERVEVIRGGTALFGAGAPGGVINLITRRAFDERLEMDAVVQAGVNDNEFGDTREIDLYLGAGQSRPRWDYYAGVSYQDVGTRRNPDGGLVPGQEDRGYGVDGSAGLRIGGGDLRFTGTYFFQNPGTTYDLDGTQLGGIRFADSAIVVTPPNPFQDQAESQVMTGALSFDHPAVLGHRLNASLYLHDESHIQRMSELFEGEVFYTDSDQDNQRQGLRSTLSRDFAVGAGRLEATYGLDLLRQRFYRPLVDPGADRAVVGYISPEVVLSSVAVFAQPQFRTGRWLFTGGVRYERFSGTVGDEGFDPALEDVATPGDIPDFGLALFNAGVVYDLTPALQVYGGFSQGAEIAEFGRAARASTDPSLINLDGAPSSQYEIGVRGRGGPVDFTAAAFYSDSDEAAELDFDPSCAGEPICPLLPVRLSETIKGVEATADWPVSDRLALGTIVTLQDGEFAFPDEDPVPLGSDVVSPFRMSSYGEVEPVTGWRTRLQATYTAATDHYSEAQEAEGFLDNESLFLADLVTSYPVGPGRVALGFANLLNKRYVNVANSVRGDFFYYLSEGRRTTLSYTVRW